MSLPSTIIVALDFAAADEALAFAGRVQPAHCRLKVGLELFTAAGPAIVRELVGRGFDVFLDLKYHDIPNTVAQACRRAAELGVWMLNVHCLGGPRMLSAAREAVDEAKVARTSRDVPTPAGAAAANAPHRERPLLVGVTMLTSHAEEDAGILGLSAPLARQVERLAGLARAAGLDGVVCSPHEAARIRSLFGDDFCLVTPGIRPAGEPADDQRRTMSPAEAVRLGADYLVIGRPVTRAPDPMAVLDRVRRELAAAS